MAVNALNYYVKNETNSTLYVYLINQTAHKSAAIPPNQAASLFVTGVTASTTRAILIWTT